MIGKILNRASLLLSHLIVFLLIVSCTREHGGDDATGADATQQRSIAVTLTMARQEEVRVELFSVGRLVSKNTPLLAAEINARVVDVLVDEGQAVVRGQVLILLDKTTLELSQREAQAEIQRLKAGIANDERRVSRYRDLKTKDVMPQEQLDDAEAKLAVDRASLAAAEARFAIAEDRLAKAELISPVNGVVERRHVSVGDYVKIGAAMVTVTDTHDLRAELPFPETVGHQLKEGQVIYLASPIAPGLIVEANVSRIRPQVGSMSRSLLVIADVDNPGSWRPEATVEATLIAENRPDAVVVPLQSVVKRPAGDVVYRLEEPLSRRVQQVIVELGIRKNGWVEIRSGLQAGDLVVVEGAHYLSDDARVMVQESKL